MADIAGVGQNATVMQDVAPESFNNSGDKRQLIDGPDGDSLDSAGHEVSPLHLETHQTDSAEHAKTSEGLKIIIVSSIVFAVATTVALILTIYLAPPQVEPHGAVATDSQECSELGTDILKKGGSAVDAAVMATLCMGLVHPSLTGLGGGGFMIVRQHKEKKTRVFDFRETAPASAEPDMLENYDENTERGKTVGVPGLLKGLEEAYNYLGKLKWKDLVKPVSDMARNGFQVTGYMDEIITQGLFSQGDFPALDPVFFPGDQPAKEGDIVKWPAMADVLDDVADRGSDAFYTGDLAKEIFSLVKENQGILSLSDLKGYDVEERDPLVSTFLDMSIETVPPPAMGSSLVFMLNIMEGYYKHSGDVSSHSEDPYIDLHHFIEAMKFAHGHESLVGDPMENDLVIGNSTKLLLNKEYAAELRNITENGQMSEDDPSFYSPDSSTGLNTVGTNHVSVIGPNEDHVAITTTMNSLFGSRLSTKSGIILNDEMLDFETDSSKADSVNLIAPRKRPASHMVPTIIHSRNRPCGLRIAVGGANGSRITTGVAEVILNMLGKHMKIGPAVEALRLYHYFTEDGTGALECDKKLNETIKTYLTDKGHPEPTFIPDGISFVNAVAKMNETMQAHSDSRKFGKASVF